MEYIKYLKGNYPFYKLVWICTLLVMFFLVMLTMLNDNFPLGFSIDIINDENKVQIESINEPNATIDITKQNALKIALLQSEINFFNNIWFISIVVVPILITGLFIFYTKFRLINHFTIFFILLFALVILIIFLDCKFILEYIAKISTLAEKIE